MKTQAQIQAAHDLLTAFLSSEEPKAERLRRVLASQGWVEIITPQLGVLCWLLDHKDGQPFEAKLAQLRQALETLGLVMTPVQEEVVPPISLGGKVIDPEQLEHMLEIGYQRGIKTPGGVL